MLLAGAACLLGLRLLRRRRLSARASAAAARRFAAAASASAACRPSRASAICAFARSAAASAFESAARAAASSSRSAAHLAHASGAALCGRAAGAAAPQPQFPFDSPHCEQDDLRQWHSPSGTRQLVQVVTVRDDERERRRLSESGGPPARMRFKVVVEPRGPAVCGRAKLRSEPFGVAGADWLESVDRANVGRSRWRVVIAFGEELEEVRLEIGEGTAAGGSSSIVSSFRRATIF